MRMVKHPIRLRHPRVRSGLVVVASLLWFAACGSEAPVERARDSMVPAVEAVQADRGSLPLTQRLSGAVRARNQVAIYPEISAVVTEVLVENGDSVREGQPLVRLRDDEFRERLRQAQANHQITVAELRRARAQAKEAEAELRRARSLADQEYGSEAELDAAEARAESAAAGVELAEARVEQALASVQEQEQNLARTIIRAPITGRAGSRNAEVGMLVSPSTRLFTLGQLDSVRVEVVLTDRMLDYVEEGQRTEITAGGVTRTARLSRISPFLNPVSHSTEAEIDLDNPGAGLKPGMFVTVDVFYGESAEATLVPRSALYEHPATGAVGVYVTPDALEDAPVYESGATQSVSLTEPVGFEFVPVDVVAEGHMHAAIRGVEAGTWVVTLGQNLLGGDDARARVRPVRWERVERLQRLQREDLMEEVIERESSR